MANVSAKWHFLVWHFFSGGSKVHVWRCQFCWYRFWPIFRAQKNPLKFQLVVWAGSAHILLSWGHYLPGPLPIGQVNFKRYLLIKKIYLSQITKSDFFKLFFINFTQAAIFGSGCWATSHDVNEVGVACCTSGLFDFVHYFFFTPRALSYSLLKSDTLVTRLNFLLQHSFCICFTRLWGAFNQDSSC